VFFSPSQENINYYYEVLGLNSNASKDEIKKAKRCLLLLYHPDRNKGSDAKEKTIEIIEAFEYLYNRITENIQPDFADTVDSGFANTVEPGKVRITYTKYSNVTIEYGQETESGDLRASQNNKFYVFFNNKKIILIQDDCLIWIRDFERLINIVVSDNGIVALLNYNHTEDSSSSSPKEFIDRGGTLSVIDKSGELIFTYEFGSNVEAITISPDGKLVALATLYPNNTVYCFDISKRRLLWKYQNHIKRFPVLELNFTGSHIDVIMGNSIATANKEYELNLDGTLTIKYQQKLDSLKKIKKGNPQEKVEYYLSLITSGIQRDVREGLAELAKFVKTKGVFPYYEQIVHTLGNLLRKEFNHFDNIWKVVREILKTKPEAVSIIVPFIISELKMHPQNDACRIILVFGELGSVNPMWICDDLEFIRQKLRSPSSIERSKAIWAIGSIGSADPSLVINEIPFLIEYASNPERMTKQIKESLQESNPLGSSGFGAPFGTSFFYTMSGDNDIWLRNDCIDAIGTIGKQYPEYVKSAIPLLKKLSKLSTYPYTMKRANYALDAIARNYD
jgi:hypothetical protein